MLSCLLAPVPVEHIDSAAQAFAATGRVAFASGDPTSEYSGSSTWKLFTDLGLEGEFGKLPVFIHASLSGRSASHPRYHGQVVSWRGVLAGYETPASGKYPKPEERPASALLTDAGPAVGYWIVEGLTALEKDGRLPLGKFRTHRAGKPGSPVDGILRGPIRAFAPLKN